MAEIIKISFEKKLEEDTNNVIAPTEEFWRCECGGVLFFLTKTGAKCKNCGLISNDWVE